MISLLSFFLFLNGAIYSFGQDGPVVNTPLGSILGTVSTSWRGTQFYSFRGVRYAEPPLGELRFKPPVPKNSWEGVFNATQDGKACIQPGNNGASEDCLFLVVHTRRINQENDLKPVIVYIHGGSWVGGSGLASGNGPDYLMDHDIVLVTINYRLGTLGFFSTGDEHAPGNYGTKDMVEALRWVRDNIKSFGGDPNKVTISGESAGGASIAFLVVSPMARGLFHRAIILSESAKSWYPNSDALDMAKKQASLLNCPTDNSKDMVDCMRNVPADQIGNIYGGLQLWNGLPIVIYSPVIEADSDASEKFLTSDPVVSMSTGDYSQVPIFIGSVKDEFAYLGNNVVDNADWAADMSNNWNTVAPKAVGYKKIDEVSQKLRQFYLGSVDKPITNDSVNGLRHLFADGVIIFPVVRSAKLFAQTSSSSVFLYQFNYQRQDSTDQNIYHAADMRYVFSSNPPIDVNSEDGHCVDRITTLWANFAETGNPTPEASDVLNNVIWTPLKPDHPTYLNINKTLALVEGLYYEDRMNAWEDACPVGLC